MYVLGGAGIQRGTQRTEAEHYMLLMIVSYAASVVLTRFLFQLTGFPQLGGGVRIAQLVWGGFLPSASALLVLSLTNRWVLRLSAILGGIGVGLFIDEVGQFIAASNDYFYPLAASVIYGCFLLTIMLYFQTRRHNIGSGAHYPLDYLAEMIDDDNMNEVERAKVERYLRRVGSDSLYPDRVKLANTLLEFIRVRGGPVAEYPVSRRARWRMKLVALEAKWIDRRLVKAGIVMGLLMFGLLAANELLPLIQAVASSNSDNELGNAVAYAGQGMAGLVGTALLVSAGLMIVRRERVGLVLGYVGLLFYLIIVNLLVFGAEAACVMPLQIGLLWAILRRRRRYLIPRLLRSA